MRVYLVLTFNVKHDPGVPNSLTEAGFSTDEMDQHAPIPLVYIMVWMKVELVRNGS